MRLIMFGVALILIGIIIVARVTLDWRSSVTAALTEPTQPVTPALIFQVPDPASKLVAFTGSDNIPWSREASNTDKFVYELPLPEGCEQVEVHADVKGLWVIVSDVLGKVTVDKPIKVVCRRERK